MPDSEEEGKQINYILRPFSSDQHAVHDLVGTSSITVWSVQPATLQPFDAHDTPLGQAFVKGTASTLQLPKPSPIKHKVKGKGKVKA